MEEDRRPLTERDRKILNEARKVQKLRREQGCRLVDCGVVINNTNLRIEIIDLKRKIREQEKVIELMSNSIHQLVTQNDIAKYFQKRYCKAFYSEDISKCKDLICEECVKNYFIKKAKGE